MNIFKLIFPTPTKQKTLEKLAYWRARRDVAISHEKMSKFINRPLLERIENMSGEIAMLEARLKSFE